MTNIDSFSKNSEDYEKMIEAIKRLDFEHLHGLYIRRREGFLKNAREGTHKEITTRFLYAIISTDVCMEIFQDFLLAMGQKAEEISKKAEQDVIEHRTSTNEALDKLKGIVARSTIKREGRSQRRLQRLCKSRQAIYENIFDGTQDLALFKSSINSLNIFLVTVGSTATYGSLARLFEITDLTLVGEVMILALQTLLGLIPFAGTAGTALWGLYDIYDRKAKQYKKAGDLLTQLDNYSEVAFNWSTITQMMIELHKGNLSIQDNETYDLEKMVGEKEIERLSKIIQERIDGHVKKYTEEFS